MNSGVLIVMGATASGKTALAEALAEAFDAELIGADSRQVYAGMPIGTAAPVATPGGPAYHLVSFLAKHERYSAARFAEDAMVAIAAIHARGKRAIVVGGTGFYVRALAGDLALAPERDDTIRARIEREKLVHEPGTLHAWLRALDPVRAQAVLPNDPYRIGRALEIALLRRTGARNEEAHATGRERPVRASIGEEAASPPVPAQASTPSPARSLRTCGIPFRKIALHLPPEELAARIAARTSDMLARGFLAEAEAVGADAVAANAVGYHEALDYLAGFSTYDEMRTHLERGTRRYAKRQLTWLRGEPDLTWVDRSDALREASAVARTLPGWV